MRNLVPSGPHSWRDGRVVECSGLENRQVGNGLEGSNPSPSANKNMKKLLTLCIPCREHEVLLGMKKRGFGVGRWNGFGGKVSPGESIEAAALRELEEEVGLTPTDLTKVGILTFSFKSTSDVIEVHIFRTETYNGTVCETEEMRPAWFAAQDIPFEQMWSDDEYWFPYFLSKKRFVGAFHFDKPADQDHPATILRQELREVAILS